MTSEHATDNVLPLAGIKVLELGHIVAGPSAGQMLADLGAEVMKVESVDGGDQARRAPGATAAHFHFFNRNKTSIALDLKRGGRGIFLKLAAQSDVVIDNFGWGAVDKLEIGFDTARLSNPGLVWLAVKGFLPGPAARRPLLDELAQMMGGLAFMTGPAGKPMRAGASVIDIGAATYGVIGVLAALRQRELTGQGQHITAGLYETSVYWVGQWMATAQAQGGTPSVPLPELQQGTRMGWGVYQLFDTRDADRVFIGITSNAHWDHFCHAFNRLDLFADPRYADNTARVALRHELAAEIAATVRELDSLDVQRLLEKASVPFAPIRRPDQLAGEPHLRGADQLMKTPMPDGSFSWLPKLPFFATGFRMGLRRGAPRLGEQTRAVLTGLGYSTQDIDALVARGDVLDGTPARN